MAVVVAPALVGGAGLVAVTGGMFWFLIYLFQEIEIREVKNQLLIKQVDVQLENFHLQSMEWDKKNRIEDLDSIGYVIWSS